MAQIPFASDVFTWPAEQPKLIGGRCSQCACVAFPRPGSCARCGSLEIDEHLLTDHGTLWTFTTQGFLPKEPYRGGETPETFEPFGVGLVELGGEVRVEARLTEADPDVLHIGMEMELAIVPFRTDEDGTEVVTYAFRPT